jgi:hypothetical protein
MMGKAKNGELDINFVHEYIDISVHIIVRAHAFLAPNIGGARALPLWNYE